MQRDPEAATATKPAPAPAPTAGAPAPMAAKPGSKSAQLTISGVFNDVPGESKAKSKPATDKDALWFDPLRTKSEAPQIADSTVQHGLVTGGEQQIESFSAPMTDTVKPVGRGSISPQLRYTSKKDQSYDVVVSNVPRALKGKAVAMAKDFVKGKIEINGDVDEISKQAGQHLAATYPDATVAVTLKETAVKDMGRDTIYYKIRGDSAILLEVQVVPVAEKQVVTGGSTTTGGSSEAESSKSQSSEASKSGATSSSSSSTQSTSSSTEETEIAYNEAVVKTLDDYVIKVTTVHKQVASELSNKVVKDDQYRSTGHTTTVNPKTEKITDYTEKIEKGKRDKSNWADKIKKGVKVAKKVTSIPYIDKIPGVGWLTRRVKGWQLDLVEAAADIFAETGTADYEDKKIETKTTDSGGTVRTDTGQEITAHQKAETTRTLTEDYLTKTNDEWKRHLDEVTETSGVYKSKTTKKAASAASTQQDSQSTATNQKEAAASAERNRQSANKSVTHTIQVSENWTISKPTLKASVLKGNVEVSAERFPEDPDELTSAPPTATPTTTPTPTTPGATP